MVWSGSDFIYLGFENAHPQVNNQIQKCTCIASELAYGWRTGSINKHRE